MKSLLLAHILSMAMVGDPGRSFGYSIRTRKTPEERNQYGLTDADRELMRGMSPKEKKNFLKGKRKP